MNRGDRGAVGLIVLMIFLVVLGLLVIIALEKIDKKSGVSERASPSTSQTKVPGAGLVGFNFLPKDFTAAGFADFYAKLPRSKSAVTWAGDWQELERSSASPHVVAQAAKEHKFEPIFLVSTHKDGGSFEKVIPLRPVETNTKAYVDSSVAFCKKYSPNYFGIGVETNRIFASSASEFEKFVKVFNQTADAMHSACPNIKIFSAFQLEHLRGLRGGLYGGVNNENKNYWQLLDRLAKADFFAFTTYPGIVFKDPNDIPADYYSSISSHTNKPVAFTEVSWPSEVGVAGWSSSEDEQARFAKKFIELTSPLKPLFSIWPFLYDQNLPDPFKGIGLMRTDGSQRPSYQIWTSQ